jgi:hypothetical protein
LVIPATETKAGEPADVAESFYIPATASPSRPRRTLKYGDSFAVVDSHGDIGASRGGKGRHLSCRRTLSLAHATVDLALHGRGDDVSLRVLRSDGGVRVSAVYC